MADKRKYREYDTTVNGEKVTINLCWQSDINMLEWNEIWALPSIGQQTFAAMMKAAKTAEDKKNVGLINQFKAKKIMEKWNEDAETEEDVD